MANQNPTGAASTFLTEGKANTAYTLYETQLLNGFFDPDGDLLKVINLISDSGEINELGAGGQWSFTPETNFSGQVTFNYLVSDGNGGEALGALNLNVVKTNNPPSGNLVIDGMAQAGKTLGINPSQIYDLDGVDFNSFNYQWFIDGNLVSTGFNYYTINSSDTGKTIHAEGNYIDNLGNFEMVRSNTVQVLKASNTPASGDVKIGGLPNIGSDLFVDTTNLSDQDGGVDYGSLNYQWFVNGNPTFNGNNYTLTNADAGKNISVKVSFKDLQGNNEEKMSGSLFVKPQPSYSFFADKTTVTEGETTNLILLTQNVSAGTAVGFTFFGSANLSDVQGGFIPNLFFVNADGKTTILLTFLNDKIKEGMENMTFTLNDDSSKSVAINIMDGVTVNTPATGIVIVKGDAKPGKTVFADASSIQDVDGLGGFKFQWLLNGNPIAGQNGANYTPILQDENKALSVELNFIDGAGNQEKFISPIAFIQPTEKIYKLFADKTNITEGETTNLILQTQNVPAGQEIYLNFIGTASVSDVQNNLIPTAFIVNTEGKTSIPLTFLNDKIKEGTENITFTLSNNTSQSVTININDGINDSNPQPQNNNPPTGQIFIEGEAKIGKTLRVKIDNVQDADGLGTFNFQWLRDGKPLAGKTSKEYVLEKDDAGKNISVQLSYTDLLDNLEMLNSMPITTSGSSTSPISPTGVTTLTAQNPNFKGTGTNADHVEGSAIGDSIAGVLGNDTLRGNSGDDTIDGGNGNDQLFGDADSDLLLGGDGDDFLDGGADNDTLEGGNGNDTLDGGFGADKMTGGNGDDEYFIDNIGDEVIESTSATGGKDTVHSTITWRETNGIEKINLLGENDIDAEGDNKANTITGNLGNNHLKGNGGNDSLFGNEGNDTLDGGAGADYLNGGEGDDVYIIDNSADVIEDSDGNDSVQSYITISLAAYPTIENLDLIGENAIKGTGNDNNNIITGNSADNELKGMAGDDILFGNDGDDTLIGGEGNNVLDGGNDEDTAVYHGLSSDYDLKITDSVTVTNILTGEIDELIDMEFVQFNDTILPIIEETQELVLSVADVKIKEGNVKNGTVKATIVLKLDKTPDEEVSVDVTTEDITAKSGEDYVPFTKTVTFKANQKTQKIRLDIKSDLLAEDDETFALLLSNPSDNVTLENSEAIVTILNDDKPTLSIQNASVTEGAIGKMNAVLQVNLSTTSNLPVTVSYKTVNGTAKSPSDYTATSGKLTFAAGETSKTILVPIVDDKIAEASEQFRVTLSSAKNATLATGKSTAKVTILDNDKATSSKMAIVESSAKQEIIEQDLNAEIQITGVASVAEPHFVL